MIQQSSDVPATDDGFPHYVWAAPGGRTVTLRGTMRTTYGARISLKSELSKRMPLLVVAAAVVALLLPGVPATPSMGCAPAGSRSSLCMRP
jgi:hypothetical protein